MNITHGNCIYTFDNDYVTVCKTLTTLDNLKHCVKVILTPPKTNEIRDVIDHIAHECKIKMFGALEHINDKYQRVSWNVKRSDMFFVLSPTLFQQFQLQSEVLTPWNLGMYNADIFKTPFSFQEKDELSIIVVPIAYPREEITLKEVDEWIDYGTLLQRYRTCVPTSIARLSMQARQNKLHLILDKVDDQPILVVHSEALQNALQHRHAGKLYQGELLSSKYPRFTKNFINKWDVYLYKLDNVLSADSLCLPISMPNGKIFHTFDQVKDCLNEALNEYNIHFSLNSKYQLQVEIKDNHVSIEFEDTLRDILAFDANRFKGKGIYSASDTMSLTRRIRFLYIYSNVSNDIRIGDTEAPLLGIAPFRIKSCRTLTEKVFKNPMYIPVRCDHMSQIDISIYDDAGKRIPFIKDMSTSLRLHFRQK